MLSNMAVYIIENKGTLLDSYFIFNFKKSLNLDFSLVEDINLIQENFFKSENFLIYLKSLDILVLKNVIKRLKKSNVIFVIENWNESFESLGVDFFKSKSINKLLFLEYSRYVCQSFNILDIDDEKINRTFLSIRKYLKDDNLNVVLSYLPLIYIFLDKGLNLLPLDEIKKFEVLQTSLTLLHKFLLIRKDDENLTNLLVFWMSFDSQESLNLVSDTFYIILKVNFGLQQFSNDFIEDLFSKYKGVSNNSLFKFSLKLSEHYILISQRFVFGLSKFLNSLVE